REQRLARVARSALGLLDVLAELALEHAVDPLELLLLAVVQAEVGDLRAPLGVDAGRVVEPRHRALVREATLALEEGLHALPAAQLALVVDVSSHVFSCSSYTRRRLRARQPLCGSGVTSSIEITRSPAFASARTADSRPEPTPFTSTSTSRMP